MDENVELERAYASVIGRVAVDSEFRAALVANPAAVLKSQGIDFPEGVELEVLEASATKGYIVLPDQSVVSDELLSAAAGGGTASTAGTAGSLMCFTGPSTMGTAGSAGSVCK